VSEKVNRMKRECEGKRELEKRGLRGYSKGETARVRDRRE